MELKPCPFCGNKDVKIVIIPKFDPTIAVECSSCRTRGPEYLHKRHPLEADNDLHILWWNTRSNEE